VSVQVPLAALHHQFNFLLLQALAESLSVFEVPRIGLTVSVFHEALSVKGSIFKLAAILIAISKLVAY
jgi:hypothetical protein